MAANLVVPSDITILENKKMIGKRKLGLFEWTGLLMTAPMIHIHYSKMDRGDMRAVLTKKFDPEDNSPVGQIVRRRQQSVHKHVLSQNFMWGGGVGMAGMVYWSFRRYNYQSRLIATPFMFYIGTFVGRAIGDVVTGRNAEFARDRFLGSLPAKVYYAPPEEVA
mmetsp:Transcript_37495/g.104203  ORF Transcript_37495/g.104203 Transcript_37495/m.104203 type:complete len:164 (-) Transcript_37495:101-592(-)|eukprot:CAMPEP_0179141660 /NCGR_PEP_ID=MMETSP0796-20121207/67968_1 /TAXON_ID=73915 /ORGANISM="Pyrodinium bahamense, Strain pbaha01" /LENGTH=163 /DNA_ID=CAMNT_0020841425 /DNA_START=90 /DNA_END=581 /DNA_ORIENTATION=+